MTLNERLLEFLNGSLAPDDEAELLHTLSVSPEKRAALRDFMNGERLLARDREVIVVPYEAERALWSRLDVLMPLAPAALDEAAPLVMQTTRSTGWWSRIVTPVIGTLALVVGLGAGYIAGTTNSTTTTTVATTTVPHVSEQQQTTVFNALGRPVTVKVPYYVVPTTVNIAPLAEHATNNTADLGIEPTNVEPANSEITADLPISNVQGRNTTSIAPHNRIGGSMGIAPAFYSTTPPEQEKSFLQRFEFAVDESFGRQFPNSPATNVSLPLVTNSSIGAFFQILPHSHLLWLGAAYGTANVTQKSLFKRDYNTIDPVQEVLASDTIHSQTSYFAGYLQFRFPAFQSADITLTGGYGLATIGQMLMGEIGMHYDLSSQVGVNVGLRARSFSYDLTAAKDAAVHSGTGGLAVPAGIATASASVNTELTTGLFFHF